MDLTLPPPAEPSAEDTDDAAEPPDAVARPLHVDGGLAGGVAAHLGRQLGVDPLWIRIAFVLLALVGGVGIVVYAGLWLALVVGPAMGWSLVGALGGAIVVLGVPLLLLVIGVGAVDGWLAVVLLLAGLALALWQPRRSSSPTALVPTRTSAALVGEIAPESVAPPPRQRREPSLLGRACLGLAIVVAAVGALVDDANGGRFHPEQWLGAAALVCGAGLLIGTFAGRGRWLLLPALVFAASGYAAGELARLGIPLGRVEGDEWVSVENGAPVEQSASTGFGDVHVSLDLVAGELDRDHRVEARSAFGTVYVAVPTRDVEVEVRARTDRGRSVLDGQAADDVVILNPGASGGRLVVDAWAGNGDVEVYQSYAGDGFASMTTWAPMPVPTVPLGPGLDTGLIAVDGFVSVTTDGWIVLANGEVVIDPDDGVVAGQSIPLEEWNGVPATGESARSLVLPTSIGEFQLLPRSLLLLPDGRLVDLIAIRASVAADQETKSEVTVDPTPDPVEPELSPPTATVIGEAP